MQLSKKLNQIRPEKLFLTDSLGALLTAAMLGLVLASFESTFGVPQEVLYRLSFIAGIFFIYSFSCFLKTPKNWRPFMKTIAVVNLLYCCLTVGLIFHLYQKLTLLGILYFVAEIIVVVVLAIIELKTASNPLVATVKEFNS